MWPTPTPIPPAGGPNLLDSLNIDSFGQNVTGGLVQGFNFFDAQPIAGVVWFIFLAFILLFGLMSIRHHLESMDQNGG
jgi:hypothetical protein